MSWGQPPGYPPQYPPPPPNQGGYGYGPPPSFGGYQPQPPPKKKGLPTILYVIMGVFALGFCGAVSRITSGPPPPPPQKSAEEKLIEKCGGNHVTVSDCQEQMRARLKDPDSAEFEGIIFGPQVNTLPDCTQTYVSHVNAKNSFGLMVRTNFSCTWDPKKHKVTFNANQP